MMSPHEKILLRLMLLPLAILLAVPAAAQAADWNGRFADQGLTASVDAGSVPFKAWLWTPKETYVQQIIVAQDRVVVDVGRELRALDLASGRTLWVHEVSQAGIYGPTMVVAHDVVFRGPDGRMEAYDLATGRFLWASHDAGLPIAASARGVAGLRFTEPNPDPYNFAFGGNSTDLVLLDSHTGKEQWSFIPDGFRGDGSLNQPVAFSGNVVLYSGANLHALDLTTGMQLWQAQRGNAYEEVIYGSGRFLAVGESDIVFVHIGTGQVFPVAQINRTGVLRTAAADTGHAYLWQRRWESGLALDSVTAVDLATGATMWQRDLDEFIMRMAVRDGRIYFGGAPRDDGGEWPTLVEAFDAASGRPLWRIEHEDTFRAMGVAPNVVVVATSSHVFSIDAATGAFKVASSRLLPAPGPAAIAVLLVLCAAVGQISRRAQHRPPPP